MKELQNDKLVLEEQLAELKLETISMKVDGKTYSATMRMLISFVNLFEVTNIFCLVESLKYKIWPFARYW